MDREKIKDAFESPIPSIRTPFRRNGDIDGHALQRMIDFDIAAGARVLLLTFGDSLFSILSDREICDLTGMTIKYACKRAVIAASTGRWNTKQSVEFALSVREIGADILQVITTQWYPSSSTIKDVVQHHAEIAKCMPVMVNTGCLRFYGFDEGLKIACRLLEAVDGIIAAKLDAEAEFDAKVTKLAREKWVVFMGGQKSNHLAMLPHGCHGYLSTFITFNPGIAHRYWQAVQSKNMTEAQEITEKIDRPFFNYITSMQGGFDAALHGIMEIYGLAERWRRKPFYSISDDELEKIRNFLNTLFCA